MSVLQETVSLAAQLRAFFSLLSLPSRAQSVIKAFRRQGIGFADVVNTARFFLSRLESLFASQKVFQIFRGRAEARLCDLFRSAAAALHKPHRLAKARIKVVAFVVLSVGLCKSRKDPYLPPKPLCVRLLPRTNVLASYGICRQFPHPLSRTRKPPSNTIGHRGLTDASALVTTSPSCPARPRFLDSNTYYQYLCIVSLGVLNSLSGTYVFKIS